MTYGFQGVVGGKIDLVILICGDWSHCAISKASDLTAWRSAIALAVSSLLFASDGVGELVRNSCRASCCYFSSVCVINIVKFVNQC
jgi:hypothetical protein